MAGSTHRGQPKSPRPKRSASSPTSLAQSLYAPQGKIKGSVTRLEAYQSCPFKHFAQYGLRLKQRPEFRLAPPQVGVFLHGVLKKYGQTLLDDNKKWHEISPEHRAGITDKIIHELAGKLQNEILYSNAQYQYFLTRLSRTVERAINHLSTFSAHTAFHPLALEQSFGDQESGWAPLRIHLSGDISLEISGQIDRIDGVRTEEKTYLLVIDYKSGSKKLTLNEAYHGLSLQLLTYLLVALEGAESLVPSTHPYGAGILYYFLKNPLLTSDEPLTSEEAQAKLNDSMRMPGWLLKDKEVINFIETNFQEEKETFFVPKIKLTNKDDFHGSFTGNLKSQEDFTEILEHLQTILAQSGEGILQGKIEISPYQIKNSTPCGLCNYRPFCSFDRFQGNAYRELESLSDQEILQRLRKENDHDPVD